MFGVNENAQRLPQSKDFNGVRANWEKLNGNGEHVVKD